ncbi:MAG: tRNA (adenosine(37)-N6)-threonylcarbamoyltransferase complex ATPase subunit type 1 TsaE [Candidatus Adiutrix sp.]|jgi:tRNA threonylcarbamoyladenosine biosynthesis protein TsaE|nr:tRNA (adenosine(37)-N6)-threonylcarbamoyltransferase complex ATPase subunit type 1 TsaE [Candidatus Adiutrix sp.]
MLDCEIFLPTAEDTFKAGARLGTGLAAALSDGSLALPCLITLRGDLGAGKTTFCQGLCQALEVSEPGEVISPTFTLANEYRGLVDIFHLDLYRLTDPEQFYQAGLDEYLLRPALTLIEWPERLPSWPGNRLDVTLNFQDEGRFLTVKSSQDAGQGS